MTAWRQTLRLPGPLRDARPTGAAVPLCRPGASAAPSASPSAAEVGSAPGLEPKAVEEMVKSSYERGRLDGEKLLSQQLLEQRTELQRLFQGALAALQQAVPQVVRDTEQMMVSLAFEIARKLVADLPISVEMVEASVREALAQMEGAAECEVRLHPEDLDLLRKAASPLLQSEAGNRVRFQASPDVTRGGCLVHTRFGVIDARRETKLDLLKQSLTP